MNILVCGGRTYDDYDVVASVLHDLIFVEYKGAQVAIVHGGANGADKLAGRYAKSKGLCEIVVPANWDVHGRAAGPIRNQWMMDHCKPNLVVAFPGGRGTTDMKWRARKAGVGLLEVP